MNSQFAFFRVGTVASLVLSLMACWAIAPAIAQDQNSSSEWTKRTPTGARASFEMPIKPRFVERSFAPIQGKPPVKVRLHIATVLKGEATYVFGYHDLHEAPSNGVERDNTLEGAVKGAVGNVLGQLLKDPTKITYNKYPGRQFEYHFTQNEKRFIVMSRVFLVGKRQYQISAVMSASIFDETLAAKFLNSFVIITPEYDLPPRPKAK